MTKQILRGEIEVSALVPYSRNARTHSQEQINHLVRMIRDTGFINPVVIDENNELIAGHGRIIAAVILCIARVPFVRLIGFSESEKMRFRIEDNSVADMSGWDIETLAAELDLLEAEGCELDSFAFDDEVFRELEEYFNDDSDEAGGGGSTAGAPAYKEFQQKAFTFHNDQAAIIDKAIKAALKLPECDTGLNTSEGANALTLICSQWLRSRKSAKGGV